MDCTLMSYLIIHHQESCRSSSMLPPKSFIVLCFTFRSMVNFELIFMEGLKFCRLIFSNTRILTTVSVLFVQEITLSLLTALMHLSKVSCLSLSGSSWALYSINLGIYSFASTILSQLLWLYNQSWNQAEWVFQLCPFSGYSKALAFPYKL